MLSKLLITLALTITVGASLAQDLEPINPPTNWTYEDELDCIEEISYQYQDDELEQHERDSLELECIHWYQDML